MEVIMVNYPFAITLTKENLAKIRQELEEILVKDELDVQKDLITWLETNPWLFKTIVLVLNRRIHSLREEIYALKPGTVGHPVQDSETGKWSDHCTEIKLEELDELIDYPVYITGALSPDEGQRYWKLGLSID
jgi:hypothetical protein